MRRPLGSGEQAGHAGPVSQTSTQTKALQEYTGLSAVEVAARVRDGLTNAYRVRTSRSTTAILRANIFTIFNAILATALIIVLTVGHWADALFGFVLILNTATGTIAEVRAKRALDRLAFLDAPTACVVRDGREIELAVADVVLDAAANRCRPMPPFSTRKGSRSTSPSSPANPIPCARAPATASCPEPR